MHLDAGYWLVTVFIDKSMATLCKGWCALCNMATNEVRSQGKLAIGNKESWIQIISSKLITLISPA